MFSGADLGGIAIQVAERFRTQAEQRGQRHAVDVARGRGFGGVDVGMGVDPEHADLLVLAAVELGHPGDGARRQRMIAAQHQGRHALFQGLEYGLGGAVAGLGNLLQVAGLVAAGSLGFGDFHADVAAIGHAMPQGLQPGFQAGDPHRRGSHVHAPAAGPHVERNADDANAAGGQALGAARPAGSRIGDFNEVWS